MILQGCYIRDHCSANGKIIDKDQANSWETGVDGALPRYLILAATEQNSGQCYRQEYLKDAAEDLAKNLRFDAEVTLSNEVDNQD